MSLLLLGNDDDDVIYLFFLLFNTIGIDVDAIMISIITIIVLIPRLYQLLFLYDIVVGFIVLVTVLVSVVVSSLFC